MSGCRFPVTNRRGRNRASVMILECCRRGGVIDGTLQVLTLLSGQQQVGDYTTPINLLRAIPLDSPLRRLFKPVDRRKSITGMSPGVVGFLSIRHVSPDLLLFFRKIVPAVSDNSAYIFEEKIRTADRIITMNGTDVYDHARWL